ncbi:UNVERIFIED_CONTAM: hypothetical protein GTU68_009320 [Idotea baltica]|nr:hypothetical protein [Idotea baltica]
MMNHFGLKPYKCSLCSYASPRKDYLGLHMRSHSKIHVLKCQMCNYTTYRKDYLHRHKSEKHRPY